jgi:hypothetical protein
MLPVRAGVEGYPTNLSTILKSNTDSGYRLRAQDQGTDGYLQHMHSPGLQTLALKMCVLLVLL